MRIESANIKLNAFKKTIIKQETRVRIEEQSKDLTRARNIEDIRQHTIYESTNNNKKKQPQKLIHQVSGPASRSTLTLYEKNNQGVDTLQTSAVKNPENRWSLLPDRLQLKIKLVFYLLALFGKGPLSLGSWKGLFDKGMKLNIKVTNVTPATRFLSENNSTKAGEIAGIKKARAAAESQQPGNVIRKIEGEQVEFRREDLTFIAEGKITTEKGNHYDFRVTLALGHHFKDVIDLDAKHADRFIDPLVINYERTSTRMTSEKFDFDLTADGKAEKITMPSAGSGFLALDKNGNGIIDDGNELFGVKSGDGFADLAEYDDDGNGFIDENDQVFSQLSIFSKSPEGKTMLFSLHEKNIGAIALDNIETMFNLKEQHSRLRKTGIFLRNDGSASTVQHVDLQT